MEVLPEEFPGPGEIPPDVSGDFLLISKIIRKDFPNHNY